MSVKEFENIPLFVPSPALRGWLGLARRAGFVTPGVAPVVSFVKGRKKPKLVLIADEAADTTKSKLWGLCFAHHVPYITLLSDGLMGDAIGMDTALYALALSDARLAEKIKEACLPAPQKDIPQG